MSIERDSSKKIEVLIHIMFWILLFSSPFLFMPSESDGKWFHFYERFCISQLIVILIFYINYFYFISRYLFNKKVYKFLIINIVVILSGSIFMYLIDDVFLPFDGDPRGKPPVKYGWLMKISRDSVFYILTAGLSVAIKMTGRWYGEETQRKELEKNHYQAELKNLKSQLNPHFLFNTLNNIYSLASISTERTQSAVHQLSKLLRYVLYDNNQTEVPLQNEIDFINNYLDLIRLRLSSRVDISFNITGDSSNWNIAPMLFISLIENAFKHGISSSEKSFVNINLVLTETTLDFSVKNSLFPKPKDDRSGSGIGLDNLKRRLDIIYKKNARFKTETKDNQFTAEINIIRK